MPYVERVYPLKVLKCGVRDAHLVATPHVERVYSLEVDKRGVRDAHLVAP